MLGQWPCSVAVRWQPGLGGGWLKMGVPRFFFETGSQEVAEAGLKLKPSCLSFLSLRGPRHGHCAPTVSWMSSASARLQGLVLFGMSAARAALTVFTVALTLPVHWHRVHDFLILILRGVLDLHEKAPRSSDTPVSGARQTQARLARSPCSPGLPWRPPGAFQGLLLLSIVKSTAWRVGSGDFPLDRQASSVLSPLLMGV